MEDKKYIEYLKETIRYLVAAHIHNEPNVRFQFEGRLYNCPPAINIDRCGGQGECVRCILEESGCNEEKERAGTVIMPIGYCKECGAPVFGEMPKHEGMYQCLACGYIHTREELLEEVPDFLKESFFDPLKGEDRTYENR